MASTLSNQEKNIPGFLNSEDKKKIIDKVLNQISDAELTNSNKDDKTIVEKRSFVDKEKDRIKNRSSNLIKSK